MYLKNINQIRTKSYLKRLLIVHFYFKRNGWKKLLPEDQGEGVSDAIGDRSHGDLKNIQGAFIQSACWALITPPLNF